MEADKTEVPETETKNNQSRKGRRRKSSRCLKPEANKDVPQNLKCIFLNADSLTNKMAELILTTRGHSPDIIGINEVLPKKNSRKIYQEEGYEMVVDPNVVHNKGRGSILLITNKSTYIVMGRNFRRLC